jgi:transcriptional regulator with XRE-family HTH domain
MKMTTDDITDKRVRDAMARNLRVLRESFGESQTDFAARFGLTQSTYQKWETPKGYGHDIPFWLIDAIYNKLRVDPNYLFYGLLDGILPDRQEKIKNARKPKQIRIVHKD